MNEMVKVTIANIGETITGRTPSSSCPEDFGQDYMFVTPSDNFDSKIISKTERYLSEAGKTKLENKVLPPFNIMVTCIGSAMGKISINKSACITNQQINSILVKKTNYNADYIYYVLRNSYKILRNASTGSTALPLLNKTDFDLLQISIHNDLTTQHRIAATLSPLDNKIELNNRINAQLETMAKTLYDYWFVQFDFPNAKGKPYKTNGGKMVWNEEMKREIPAGWRVLPLGELTELVVRGISPKYVEENGILVLNQKCIRNKAIDFSFARRHDHTTKNVQLKLIKTGDVLVNSTGVGTLGRVAFVKRLEEPLTTVDTHVTIVRIDPFKGNQFYLAYSLTEKQSEIELLGEGSTGQTELSRERLGKLLMVLPPPNLQNYFEKLIKPQLQKMAITETENKLLSELRDWLLPMLMNGQVKVK